MLVDRDGTVRATGFNIVVGSFDKIDIRGVGGVRLADGWKDGPATSYGFVTQGFPNLLMVAGPQSVSGSTNFPRAIEDGVDWVTALVEHMEREGLTRIESREEVEKAWNEEVVASYERMLVRNSKGWFGGYNSNVEGHGHDTFHYVAYFGGAPRYRKLITRLAEEGYREFDLA